MEGHTARKASKLARNCDPEHDANHRDVAMAKLRVVAVHRRSGSNEAHERKHAGTGAQFADADVDEAPKTPSRRRTSDLGHSTVTLFAKFRGLSIARPFSLAT